MSYANVRIARSARRESASDAAVVREAVFATRWMRLDAAVASSRGRQHAANEDWHSTLDDGTAPLFVVADGVSSGAMASRVSRELVARLHAALGRGHIDADTVKSALLEADREIGRSIASRTDAPGAATVALCVGTNTVLSRWLVAWVGDCRVYRVCAGREATAELLTVDDTYRHLNEATPPGGSPDDPARMVGNGAVDAPNVRSIGLGGDEMLVLCSDGVHRHAEPSDIGRLLRGPAPLARRCVRLIEFVRERGSSDDATVLVVHRAKPPFATRLRIGHKLRDWRPFPHPRPLSRERGERSEGGEAGDSSGLRPVHKKCPPARLARLISIAALIALIAGALMWLATDRAAAQTIVPEKHQVSVGRPSGRHVGLKPDLQINAARGGEFDPEKLKVQP